jgi:O-acetyl-ADP-ribose deacetylase (regulator of RNase III)
VNPTGDDGRAGAVRDRIEIVRGDLTKLAVDAIVNAANETLLGGGGVDGAIHRAAGPRLLEECRGLGGCATGDARLTAGHDLPARHVIHTVGPVWQGGTQGEADLLASCYRRCLTVADINDLRVVAFPAISCGVFRFPLQEAAAIAVRECVAWLAVHPTPERILFCCFGDDVARAYQSALAGLKPS